MILKRSIFHRSKSGLSIYATLNTPFGANWGYFATL
jgi:hypothetical protein